MQAGELLVELDPRDYQVAVEQAQAELLGARHDASAQIPNVPMTSETNLTTIQTSGLEVASAQATIAAAEANVAAAEQEYQSALAQVRLAQANHNNDVAEVARYKTLVDKDEVSRQQYEAKVTTAKASEATVEANQAIADSRRKQVDQVRAQVNTAVAQLNTAKAREQQARINAPHQLAIQEANAGSRQADTPRIRPLSIRPNSICSTSRYSRRSVGWRLRKTLKSALTSLPARNSSPWFHSTISGSRLISKRRS